MKTVRLCALGFLLVGAHSARAQNVAPEITELRQRIAAIRADMARVTAAADYATDVFTRNPNARFLFSASRDRGMANEFDWHTGGPPDARNADDAGTQGIVIAPLGAFESSFAAGMLVDRWRASGRSAIVIGPASGKLDSIPGLHLVPNGATASTTPNAGVTEVANLVAVWTLYMEFIASATRHQWQPGIYLSHKVPNADDLNSGLRFRQLSAVAVAPIEAGRLGKSYLDRIDSLLKMAAAASQQVLVQRAADSLRGVRAAGHSLFVSACAHYLQERVLSDTLASPFKAANGRYEIAAPLEQRGAAPGDAVLWFGYDGYDCPHVKAAQPLLQAGFKSVVVGGPLAAKLPANVMVAIPIRSIVPEHIADVPFDPEGVGSATSVEALLYYVWMKRLVGKP